MKNLGFEVPFPSILHSAFFLRSAVPLGLGRAVRIGPWGSAAEEFIGASSPQPSPPSGEEREKPPHLKLTDTGERERVDVILPNPPFGGEEEKGIQGNFPEDRQTAETAQ